VTTRHLLEERQTIIADNPAKLALGLFPRRLSKVVAAGNDLSPIGNGQCRFVIVGSVSGTRFLGALPLAVQQAD
jgi:hypothetical protein